MPVPELLFNQPAVGMSNELTLLERRLVLDPDGDNYGTSFHDDDWEVELIFSHPAPLGIYSIVTLGQTAIWDPTWRRWSKTPGPPPYPAGTNLWVIPEKRQETDGTIPILIDWRLLPDNVPKFSNSAAIDLIAAKNAGQFNTGTSGTVWQYNDANNDPFYPPNLPQFQGVNTFVAALVGGYAGAMVYIGDYREGANDSWTFKKLSGLWTPIGPFTGNANRDNAPDWKNGPEFYKGHTGDHYQYQGVNYHKDRVGSQYSSDQRPTLGYPQ